ncbi:hypothetical protein ACFL2V_15625 [Pseudomonadota bacterium]
MKTIKVLIIVVSIFLIAGCEEETIDKEIPDTAPPVEEAIVEETKTDAPTEHRKFSYIQEEVKNDEETYSYMVSTDRDQNCDSGYMGFDSPIYCSLQIRDLKNDDIIREIESNDVAYFNFADDSFPAPKGFLNETELILVNAFGDACLYQARAESYNILTEEVSPIYSVQNFCTPGALFSIDDKQFLFHFLRETPENEEVPIKLEIYKVIENVESVDLLYPGLEDSSDISLVTDNLKLIDTLDGNYNPSYEFNIGLIVRGMDNDSNYVFDTITEKLVSY